MTNLVPEKIIIVENSVPVNSFLTPKNSTTERKLGLSEANSNFEVVLSRRRSRRQLNDLTFNALAGVLTGAARVIESNSDLSGFVRSMRPYSSAGGRHPIEILVLAKRVSGLDSGLWYFNPFSLKLIRTVDSLQFEASLSEKAKEMLGETEGPPALLLYIGVLSRTLSRYENGTSLIWRDVGNLSATIGLVAESLNLGSCQLGFSELFDHEIFEETERLWLMGATALGT